MKEKGLLVITLFLVLIVGVMAYYDMKHPSSTDTPIAAMSRSGGL